MIVSLPAAVFEWGCTTSPMWFNFSTRNIDECLEGRRARCFSKMYFFSLARHSLFDIYRRTASPGAGFSLLFVARYLGECVRAWRDSRCCVTSRNLPFIKRFFDLNAPSRSMRSLSPASVEHCIVESNECIWMFAKRYQRCDTSRCPSKRSPRVR